MVPICIPKVEPLGLALGIHSGSLEGTTLPCFWDLECTGWDLTDGMCRVGVPLYISTTSFHIVEMYSETSTFHKALHAVWKWHGGALYHLQSRVGPGRTQGLRLGL